MSIRRFFSLSLRHWHGAAPHQNVGSPCLNPLIVGFIIKTIVVAFLMVVVLAAGQNEATRRLFFFTAGGIDANQAQGNNCGVTKNPKEPSAGWRTSGGFSFSQGVPVVNLILVGNGQRIGRSCVGCAICLGCPSVWSLTCFGHEQRGKLRS